MISARRGSVPGSDPGAHLGPTQRRHSLGRLAAVGQLLEQAGGRRRDRGDGGLEGLGVRARRGAQTRDLAYVLPCSGRYLDVCGRGLEPSQLSDVSAHARNSTSRASSRASQLRRGNSCACKSICPP